MPCCPVYLDNIIFNLQKAGGISVYWLELIRRLAVSSYPLTLVEHGASDNFWEREIPCGINRCLEPSLLPLQLLRYLPLSKRLPLKGPGIFHSSYYRFSRQKDLANIVTVHDFTYEYFKPFLPRFVHSRQKRSALCHADGIICISESTRLDMLKFFPELAGKKIKVIYHGIAEEFQPGPGPYQPDELDAEIIAGSYIVFVGSRDHYKNFNLAIDTVAALTGINLLIIGGGELAAGEQAHLEQRLNNRYYHLAGVDNGRLNYFYNHALCLLYPSAYEGFGLPVVEAMRAACPVVAVKVSSVPEAAGEAALLVDKADVDLFCLEIKKLADPAFRASMIRRGLANAARFSWDECFRKTVAFYDEVFTKKISKL